LYILWNRMTFKTVCDNTTLHLKEVQQWQGEYKLEEYKLESAKIISIGWYAGALTRNP
jgi:hypothetical protein